MDDTNDMPGAHFDHQADQASQQPAQPTIPQPVQSTQAYPAQEAAGQAQEPSAGEGQRDVYEAQQAALLEQERAAYEARQRAEYEARQRAEYEAHQRSAYEAQQTQQRPAYQAPRDQPPVNAPIPASAAPVVKAKGGTVKSLVSGLVGGAIGAVAVSLALNATGLIGATDKVDTTPTAVETTDSAAGQVISIDASTQDATVAQAAAAKALPSVVSVYVTSAEGSGMGSGAILDTEGNIITNYHVVEGAETVSVTIGGKNYDATVVGTDASSDLAVVHAELNGDTVTPIEIGDSDALVVGDWVMTIGSPFGLDQSVSAGIVSSLSRNQMMQSYSGNTLYTNLIQTDASINPGNSGGAMVNAQGQLVGINTLFTSDSNSFAGIGFAIPGNYAIDVANKIIAGEQVTHAYIGLSMQTVNAQNAQQYHLSVNQGAYVAEVAKDSPADKAGIEEGDIIIALGDDDIASADGMILAVRSHKIGETCTVTFMRGDEEMTAEVTFGDDAELQKLQEQQRQEQGQGYGIDQQDYGYGDGQDISYEEIIDYLFNNNRGGSYRE